MKKKKLLVIVMQNLNKINFERFGLNYNQDITKEYWSILPICNKEIYNTYKVNGYRNLNKKNFIYIQNYFHLFIRLKKIKKNVYYLILTGNFFIVRLIDIYLKLKGCKKFELLDSYDIKQQLNFLEKIKILNKFSKFFLFKKIIEKISKVIKIKFMKILETEANYFIIENQYKLNNFKNNNKEPIIANSYIYNKYICNNKLPSQNHFVFIDSEIEKSFESQLLKINSDNINKIKYWDCLDNIFCKLEEKFKGYKIKIASHFRRNINNIPSNRKFYFDKTFELIRDSKLVIAHNSTAIEWAILFKKPILLINFDYFDSLSLYNRLTIEFYRKKLLCKYIGVDTNYNFKFLKPFFYNKLFEVDLIKYQNFIDYYLNFKHSNQNSIWDSIEKKILNIRNDEKNF